MGRTIYLVAVVGGPIIYLGENNELANELSLNSTEKQQMFYSFSVGDNSVIDINEKEKTK